MDWPFFGIKKISLDLVSFSREHVDSMVKITDSGHAFRLTGIYGNPDSSQRHLTWNLICTQNNGDQQPWSWEGTSTRSL